MKMSSRARVAAMRLVNIGRDLSGGLERWVAADHHQIVVDRLRRFREGVEHDMEPESWMVTEPPMPLILSDVCDALGLDDRERATVLGAQRLQALAEILETSVRLVPSSSLPMNERQVKALRYVKEHGKISIGVYRQICPSGSDETLRRDLVDLAKQGLLIKNGAQRRTHYVLAG